MPQMLYLIQTVRNLPDVRDLKNVHCWRSLIDLLHCHNVLTNTCTCQPPEYKNLEMFRSLCIRNLPFSHYTPYLPPKILHSLCFSFLLGIKAVPRGIENNAHAKFWGANEVHCHFQQCLNTLWKSPKGPLNVSDVDNRVQKPCQLSTMYCAIWLVNFWPITILVKYLTILIALFYVFWSRTAQTRAVNPLLVLVPFFTSRT